MLASSHLCSRLPQWHRNAGETLPDDGKQVHRFRVVVQAL